MLDRGGLRVTAVSMREMMRASEGTGERTGSGSTTLIFPFHSLSLSKSRGLAPPEMPRLRIQFSTSPVLTHRASVSGFCRSSCAQTVMTSCERADDDGVDSSVLGVAGRRRCRGGRSGSVDELSADSVAQARASAARSTTT